MPVMLRISFTLIAVLRDASLGRIGNRERAGVGRIRGFGSALVVVKDERHRIKDAQGLEIEMLEG